VVDVRLLAAEFAAGALTPERIPEVATLLLEHGWDSPALRVAAGADNAGPEEQRASMQAALYELDQLPIGPEEVAARFTTHWAKRLLRGDVAPLDAAGQLWLLWHRHAIQFPEDSFWAWGTLDPDEYAAPGVKEEYERDIRDAAARWLADHGS
jgi:hypothetical protein